MNVSREELESGVVNLRSGEPDDLDLLLRDVPAASSAVPSAQSVARSFPQSADAAGLRGGTDRSYKPISNEEAMRSADRIIEEKGIAGAIDYVKQTDKPSAEHTATGISLLSRLQREAEAIKATRPQEAEGLYASAVEVASDLSGKLTAQGQAIQAASIVSRLSPDGILMYAQRTLAKTNPAAKVSVEQAQTLRQATERVVVSEGAEAQARRIVELSEKARTSGNLSAGERDEIREFVKSLQGSFGEAKPLRQTVGTILEIRLTSLESAARARRAERIAAQMAEKEAGIEYRNAGIPFDVADLRDISIIGAVKLAKGVLDVTDWSARMVDEFGEDIKPYLKKIYERSLRLLNTERVRARATYKDARLMKDVLNKIEQVRLGQRGRGQAVERSAVVASHPSGRCEN